MSHRSTGDAEEVDGQGECLYLGDGVGIAECRWEESMIAVCENIRTFLSCGCRAG